MDFWAGGMSFSLTSTVPVVDDFLSVICLGNGDEGAYAWVTYGVLITDDGFVTRVTSLICGRMDGGCVKTDDAASSVVTFGETDVLTSADGWDVFRSITLVTTPTRDAAEAAEISLVEVAITAAWTTIGGAADELFTGGVDQAVTLDPPSKGEGTLDELTILDTVNALPDVNVSCLIDELPGWLVVVGFISVMIAVAVRALVPTDSGITADEEVGTSFMTEEVVAVE